MLPLCHAGKWPRTWPRISGLWAAWLKVIHMQGQGRLFGFWCQVLFQYFRGIIAFSYIFL